MSDLVNFPQACAWIAEEASLAAFCTAVAKFTGRDLVDVQQFVALLSPNVSHLFQSPQGWSALGKVLTDSPTPPVLATVH